MDFRPAPAQQLLAATAREFLRKECPPETAQRLALDPRGFDDTLWRRMAELGWPGLLIPADLGGSDGSLLDVVLLAEELGRAVLSGPFVASAVVATSLLLAAEDTRHARRLTALAAGERIATLALVEDGGSYAPDAVRMACAVPGQLSGRKLFVKDAHVADELLVAVREGDDVGVLALPGDRPGIARRPLDTIKIGRAHV